MNNHYHPHVVFKFCPSCGAQSLYVHNSKAQKCSACGFEFYTNSAAAVAAIITNSAGQILLTKRAFEPGKGMLDLPGGFVDPLESAEHALYREIKEELNLTLVSHRYYKSFPNEYVYGGVLYFTTDLVFICTVQSLNTIRVADDVSDYQFSDISDTIIERIGLPSIKKIVQDFAVSQNK